MRRRRLLRLTGTTTAGVAGLAGVTTARDSIYVDWEFDDGTTELIPVEEFDRRSDTPSLDELDVEASSPPCCGPILDPDEILCVEC